MSGYDLLREVRADPAFGETPFIMVTAESKTDNVVAAKKAGVKWYFIEDESPTSVEQIPQSLRYLEKPRF